MGFWNKTNKSENDKPEGEGSMSEATVIDFGEVLDISFAAKLHAQLKDDVEKNSTVNFITSELTRIDASCLQVISSFMGYAKENEIKVEWANPSDVMVEAARLTGLTDVLKMNNKSAKS